METNTASQKEIKALLSEYGIAPLKKYGQNFLADANIADKTAALIPRDCCVLEIGPGLGALTTRLAARSKAVAAYEIDSGLCRALGDMFSGVSNFSLFHADFLKADVERDVLPLLRCDEVYVAANLPYYITSDCIMKLLRLKLNIKRMALMVQKEFANRITSPPGSDGWGALNASLAYFTQPKAAISVPPSCFYPAPEVSSAVLLMDIGSFDRQKADDYLETVKGLFSARRKTVKSNLRNYFGFSASAAEQIAGSAGIDTLARAEELMPEELIRISALIKEGDYEKVSNTK